MLARPLDEVGCSGARREAARYVRLYETRPNLLTDVVGRIETVHGIPVVHEVSQRRDPVELQLRANELDEAGRQWTVDVEQQPSPVYMVHAKEFTA
jgi:hypothetical protein